MNKKICRRCCEKHLESEFKIRQFNRFWKNGFVWCWDENVIYQDYRKMVRCADELYYNKTEIENSNRFDKYGECGALLPVDGWNIENGNILFLRSSAVKREDANCFRFKCDKLMPVICSCGIVCELACRENRCAYKCDWRKGYKCKVGHYIHKDCPYIAEHAVIQE